MRSIRDYLFSNLFSIVTACLVALFIGVYGYTFKKVEALESRVWTEEQKVAKLETALEERTKSLEESINRVQKSVERLDSLIVQFLIQKGISREQIEKALQNASERTQRK